MTLRVRSSFSNDSGTVIFDPEKGIPGGVTLENPIVTGIASESGEAKITIVGVPDAPGKAAKIFEIVAETNALVDMIVQNVSIADTAQTDISFTVPIADGRSVITALENNREEIDFKSLQYDDQITKIAVVGAGMRTNVGVSAKLFKALSDADINIEMISTSEIRISVVTRADAAEKALKVLHTAFQLDQDGEATVYAGTGR